MSESDGHGDDGDANADRDRPECPCCETPGWCDLADNDTDREQLGNGNADGGGAGGVLRDGVKSAEQERASWEDWGGEDRDAVDERSRHLGTLEWTLQVNVPAEQLSEDVGHPGRNSDSSNQLCAVAHRHLGNPNHAERGEDQHGAIRSSGDQLGEALQFEAS